MSVIVHIKFIEGAVPMIGFGTVTDIEPQSDRWRGWTFEVDGEGGRLIMRAPKGWPESPSEAMRQEMTALGEKSEGRFVISEPLHRCRIVTLQAEQDYDGERGAFGPSHELRAGWKAEIAKRAEEAAERERKNAETMAAVPQGKKQGQAPKPMKAAGNKPPWAKKDPTPPPSPPEEDAPPGAA